MNWFTKLRLNIKEYAKQIAIIFAVFALLTFSAKFISVLFKNDVAFSKPIISKKENKSVIKGDKNPTSKTHTLTVKVMDEFIAACNQFDFEKAYSYISKGNKEYFGSYKRFEHYLKKIFTEQKRYDLQAYSNVGDIDIYQLKLFSDFLATGLTKQEFNYLDLRIAVKLDKNEPNGLMFNLEGYIKTEDLKDLYENNDMRIDFKKSKILYKSEIIETEIQNKTDEYLILKDFGSERAEIVTIIGGEERPDLRKDLIVLKPYEKRTVYLEFYKFADDGRKIKNIMFNDIRFVKNYNKDVNITNQDGSTKYTKRYTAEIGIRAK